MWKTNVLWLCYFAVFLTGGTLQWIFQRGSHPFPKIITRNKTKTMANSIQQENNITKSSLYIFYVLPGGRLGNQLFGFASAYGIAHRYKRQLVCDPYLRKLNTLLPNLDLNKTPPASWDKWIQVDEVPRSFYDNQFNRLPDNNVTILGYLPSFKYFENVGAEIFKIYSNIHPRFLRKVNSFKDAAKDEAKKRLSYSKPTTVCVHVRRGDFVTNIDLVKTGRKVPTAADVRSAMKWMQKKFKEAIFFVASNDKVWCQRYLKKENVFISNFTSAEQDFALMQSCDHMIMTVGSYSWWAAWMTSQRGGEVMYYRDPFTVGSPIHRHFDRAARFPGNWFSYGNHSVIQSKTVAQ